MLILAHVNKKWNWRKPWCIIFTTSKSSVPCILTHGFRWNKRKKMIQETEYDDNSAMSPSTYLLLPVSKDQIRTSDHTCDLFRQKRNNILLLIGNGRASRKRGTICVKLKSLLAQEREFEWVGCMRVWCWGLCWVYR